MRSSPDHVLARLAAPLLLGILSAGAGALEGQTTGDPFPEPIGEGAEPIAIDVEELAVLPDVEGETPRMMELAYEPGTDRIFVNGMRGPIWVVRPDGSRIVEYLDIDDDRWGVQVESSNREQGFQNFALHPQFAEEGTPGYGKIYTWTDTRNTEATPDFPGAGGRVSHHTVLLEWTARNPAADTYDGGPPRELARFEQPYGNHNGGDIAFNPLADPGDPDFGLLYVGNGDGGAGGDPHDLAQNLSSSFGKILRIDPSGSDGTTGEYGIPSDNPFVRGSPAGTLPEIYAWGLRNPQHFAWDPATGRMLAADIGQVTVEEVTEVRPRGDLGWNVWEGSFRFDPDGGVRTDGTRSDPGLVYPLAEYDQTDPLLGGRSAVTGLHVVREGRIPQIQDRILFGDLPSGEIFAFDADHTGGGQDVLRRVLLDDGSGPVPLLELVNARRAQQGRGTAERADLRIDAGPEGRIFLLNKHDATIRELVP